MIAKYNKQINNSKKKHNKNKQNNNNRKQHNIK